MIPHKKTRWHTKKVHILIPILLCLLFVAGGIAVWKRTPRAAEPKTAEFVEGEFPKKVVAAPQPQTIPQAEPTQPEKPVTTPESVTTYPVLLTDTEADDLNVVVNKKHKLPSDYVPTLQPVQGGQLRPEAATALDGLFVAAKAAGLSPKVVSSYRSYGTQVNVYSNYVSQYGQQQADTFSARPGHSEHQTGLAVDVGNSNGTCELEICFGTTAFGEWLKTNAHTYGFIIRYLEGKESATGYQYEPWHLRYLGTDDASAIKSTGKTMDEYFGAIAGSY